MNSGDCASGPPLKFHHHYYHHHHHHHYYCYYYDDDDGISLYVGGVRVKGPCGEGVKGLFCQ